MSNAGYPVPGGSADGQVPVWSAAQKKWVAQAPASNPAHTARAHLAAALNIPNLAQWNEIPFDTLDWDTDSAMDVVTNKGRYTIPTPGKYQVNACLRFQPSGNGVNYFLSVWKNGATEVSRGQEHYFNPGTGPFIHQLVSDIVSLAANDFIDIRLFKPDTSGTITTQAAVAGAENYFSVVRVA